ARNRAAREGVNLEGETLRIEAAAAVLGDDGHVGQVGAVQLDGVDLLPAATVVDVDVDLHALDQIRRRGEGHQEIDGAGLLAGVGAGPDGVQDVVDVERVDLVDEAVAEGFANGDAAGVDRRGEAEGNELGGAVLRRGRPRTGDVAVGEDIGRTQGLRRREAAA